MIYKKKENLCVERIDKKRRWSRRKIERLNKKRKRTFEKKKKRNPDAGKGI